MSLESDGGMILTGETEELGEKPVPVPLCPPQIPYGLTRAWTRVFAVTGRRLTTWATARRPEQPYLLPVLQDNVKNCVPRNSRGFSSTSKYSDAFRAPFHHFSQLSRHKPLPLYSTSFALQQKISKENIKKSRRPKATRKRRCTPCWSTQHCQLHDLLFASSVCCELFYVCCIAEKKTFETESR